MVSPLTAWVRETGLRIFIDGNDWRPEPPMVDRARFSDLDRAPSALPLGIMGGRNVEVPPGRVMTVEFDLETASPDLRHDVLIIASCVPNLWRISEVDGVDYDTYEEATSVVLRRRASHESGRIRFTYQKKPE